MLLNVVSFFFTCVGILSIASWLVSLRYRNTADPDISEEEIVGEEVQGAYVFLRPEHVGSIMLISYEYDVPFEMALYVAIGLGIRKQKELDSRQKESLKDDLARIIKDHE